MLVDPIKFLIVDDMPENLVALEALVRRDGLEVLKAASGAEALELLQVHDVALAFLDVQMPGMDGFELAEIMRGAEKTKHVPIIFVTAGARDPKRTFKGYEAGAVDFLYKPIEPHILQSKADVFFELTRQRYDCANALRLNELFVGILGHDLRNPLGAVLTGAEILKSKMTDESQLRTLGRMTAAARRMTDMIEQILDLTRARLADGLGFVRTRRLADLAELVRRVVEELRGTYPQREVVVTASDDVVIAGDPERLLQLFSNLIANAFQHGVEGTPVSVSLKDDDEVLTIRVANQGYIPRELLASVFDPFKGRRDKSKTRGLGLGLFIAQQIAVAHGGRIEVTSDEATGTVFTVFLPRRAPSKELPAVRPSQGRVLVVDDDRDSRDSLREAFEAAGYEATTAANGREAFDLLARDRWNPDVVVMDVVMPIMDGLELYRSMQEDVGLCRIPVIVSTSNPNSAPKGAFVMPKPLRLERLLELVSRLVDRNGAAE